MSRPPKISLVNPDPKLDELKMQLCDRIKHIAIYQHWNSTQMAIYCGTSRSCVSQVCSYNIKKLTINQLFRYLARIDPNFEVLIATFR